MTIIFIFLGSVVLSCQGATLGTVSIKHSCQGRFGTLYRCVMLKLACVVPDSLIRTVRVPLHKQQKHRNDEYYKQLEDELKDS